MAEQQNVVLLLPSQASPASGAGEEGRPLSLMIAGTGQRGMPWVTVGPHHCPDLGAAAEREGGREGADGPRLSSCSPFAGWHLLADH